VSGPDDHVRWRAHVVVQAQDVHPGPDQNQGGGDRHGGELVQQGVGQLWVEFEIQHELGPAAQPPGGLEQFAAQVWGCAHHRQPALVMASHLGRQPFGLLGGKVGQRRGRQLLGQLGRGLGFSQPAEPFDVGKIAPIGIVAQDGLGTDVHLGR